MSYETSYFHDCPALGEKLRIQWVGLDVHYVNADGCNLIEFTPSDAMLERGFSFCSWCRTKLPLPPVVSSA